jgi:hypothetical protein
MRLLQDGPEGDPARQSKTVNAMAQQVKQLVEDRPYSLLQTSRSIADMALRVVPASPFAPAAG